MRLAGTVIWATRFREHVRESDVGGKATGGQRVREFSYSISFAVALCEGPVERIGRIWADGALLDTAGLTIRLHRGTGDQAPDPKIEAVEGTGAVPAYRGTAYLVFEDLALGPFGNRLPQINVEVIRSARQPDVVLDPVEAGPRLSEAIRAVALSPGTGEFALHTEVCRHVDPGGATRGVNVNNPEGRPDIEVALDQLAEELPNVEAVSLIVSWFGDDLRCGRCRIEPKIEEAGRESLPLSWTSAGLTTATARLVGRDAEGRPVYGGSPSDASVIAAIRALRARGYRVLVYPFLLMDIPEGNGLPDPRGGVEQPPHPWRGRITLDAVPGRAGSANLTPAAAGEVAGFFGGAAAGDFGAEGDAVVYRGDPGDWGWRRFVLHLATLSRIAGGVDAICVGSEFRGLTQIRSGRTAYPAVEQFRSLAREVRAVLPATKISYAADWSEYFGHVPDDGSGDRIFHLDPFWADEAVDFVGIDDYMSTADWRHEPEHRDAVDGAASVYSLAYLRSNVAGGENFDWYYASETDRAAQARTPIEDGAYGEPWVFRPKDIAGWWSNHHHDRVGGVRRAVPTAWVPGMKPVWLTETGCPAVDLGANRPNLFVDPKSSENGLPFGSAGARDDEMQRRYLQAKIGFWAEAAHNPVSGVYGGPMMPESGVFVWTWDARPWPDFPTRLGVWSDGVNHRLGHWITGRIAANGLAEVVAAICTRAGFSDYDVSGLHGAVHGYALDRTMTAREALQPLMTVYGFDAVESGGRVIFRMRQGVADAVVDPVTCVEGDEPGRAIVRTRASGGERPAVLRLGYVDAESDFRPAAVEAATALDDGHGVEETGVDLAMPASMARATVERWAAEIEGARESATLALPPSALAVEPGDVVRFGEGGGLWRVDRAERGTASALSLTAVDPLVRPRRAPERFEASPLSPLPGPLTAVAMDLPLADGSEDDHRPYLAVAAEPWPGGVDVWAMEDEGATWLASSRVAATVGRTLAPLPAGRAGLWQRVSVEVAVAAPTLASATERAVLGGANRLAVETAEGWEIVQYRDAALTGPGRYRLSTLLRGRRGTEGLAARDLPAGARVVALDAGVIALPFGIEEVGRPRRLRVVPAGRALDDAEAVETSVAVAGTGLRPFAPAHLHTRVEGGGVVVDWVRRTRIGGDTWFGLDVSLGEEVEAYRVRILTGGRVVREARVSAPPFRYAAAARAADGTTGGFTVEVAQVSALYGPGTARSIDVDG